MHISLWKTQINKNSFQKNIHILRFSFSSELFHSLSTVFPSVSHRFSDFQTATKPCSTRVFILFHGFRSLYCYYDYFNLSIDLSVFSLRERAERREAIKNRMCESNCLSTAHKILSFSHQTCSESFERVWENFFKSFPTKKGKEEIPWERSTYCRLR